MEKNNQQTSMMNKETASENFEIDFSLKEFVGSEPEELREHPKETIGELSSCNVVNDSSTFCSNGIDDEVIQKNMNVSSGVISHEANNFQRLKIDDSPPQEKCITAGDNIITEKSLLEVESELEPESSENYDKYIGSKQDPNLGDELILSSSRNLNKVKENVESASITISERDKELVMDADGDNSCKIVTVDKAEKNCTLDLNINKNSVMSVSCENYINHKVEKICENKETLEEKSNEDEMGKNISQEDIYYEEKNMQDGNIRVEYSKIINSLDSDIYPEECSQDKRKNTMFRLINPEDKSLEDNKNALEKNLQDEYTELNNLKDNISSKNNLSNVFIKENLLQNQDTDEILNKDIDFDNKNLQQTINLDTHSLMEQQNAENAENPVKENKNAEVIRSDQNNEKHENKSCDFYKTNSVDNEGNKEKSDSLSVDELNKSLKEASENVNRIDAIEEINMVEEFSDSAIEIEKENHEVNNKYDSLLESSSSQSNANMTSTSAELDGESFSRSENDISEVMDTEIINCNEIDLTDLHENEVQKDKEIDRIGTDLGEGDSKVQQKGKDMICDTLESNNEKIRVDDKMLDCAEVGNFKKKLSNIETTHQSVTNSEEAISRAFNNSSLEETGHDRDEDICIIPESMTSKLSISQAEASRKNCKRHDASNARKSLKAVNKNITEGDKLKSKSQHKKSEGTENTKSRPVRNAAKLAGNKIKSLVLNDMAYEEQTSSGNFKGNSEEHINSEQSCKICAHCRQVKSWKFLMVQGNTNNYLCSEQCSEAFGKNYQNGTCASEIETTGESVRKCAQCYTKIIMDDRCLFWETMDFCNENCLGKYQAKLGSNCANCNGSVASRCLGKYCVRFGFDIKQFCTATCLEDYKKGLKACSYCQKDISTGSEGFLAPVGDKGQFKDFCTQSCMEKYEKMRSNAPLPEITEECSVCSNVKPVQVEVEVDNKIHKLCSEPCFAAFKFVNNITEGQCDMCRKYFDRAKTENFSLFYEESVRSFCCKTCMNVYVLANRKIVQCSRCKAKKYNFDMIKKGRRNNQFSMMCSLNCLTLNPLSANSMASRTTKCDFCMSFGQIQYHLTMSDTTTRNFCSCTCVMSFQVMKKRLDFGFGRHLSNVVQQYLSLHPYNSQYQKQSSELIQGNEELNSPIPTSGPEKVTVWRSQVEAPCVPVIASVQSLAPSSEPTSPSDLISIPRTDINQISNVPQQIPIPTTVSPKSIAPPQIYQQIIAKPVAPKQMKNKSVLCKPYSHTKGVSCRPHPCMKETQTDNSLNRKFLIPVPVPIYVPAPMHMFSSPFPVPVPFPLPIPVPIFIPTTRNSAKGIFKEIKKIQEKIPTDPFEAELLMMAEMVAGEKKQDPTDSESEDGNDGEDGGDNTFSPENVDANNTFGDDMLQMALKMATELEEPAVDMESVLTSNTITTSTQPAVDPNKALYDQVHTMSMNRGRKRSVRGNRNNSGGTPSKRGRRTSGSVEVPLLPPPEPVPPPRIEVEKPDANLCLKYTFGVNAWRHWVMQKNAELEKAALTNRKIKLFKPELLQLTADELNFSLCLFVKEVRKPNGTEYAPDTIYYLCLGIQQYLFENGRIDNIFTDSYYEKFTDCLDEVAKKFAALYNDSQYIVTRVEEEHLWESKQLGAHSPHVLLSTLMFFNTKHFNLVTVEEHMQLSFSHIMKHWKRNPNTPGVAKVPGSRNVLLRFYPPQSALEANSRKKKVYEQQENEENPLRCPVKLYEFYLSKCPESVKTRNDVFYLLPERSCVPDSPVWYSTMALGKEPLMKMLHRVKMVKEINIALLTC